MIGRFLPAPRRTLPPALAALLAGAAAAAAASAPAPVPAAAAAVARFDGFDYAGRQPVYAKVHAGPDEYLNPVLEGFRPDPSLTRAGGDFFLVNSSFAYFPGVPVWKSTDLVHWRQVGDAISRPSQLNFSGLGVSRGVFAPDIKAHGGLFYLVNTCVDCGGNYLLTARDPAGPWSDPVWLPFDGIDPSLFFDEDGRAYVVNNGPPPGTPRYDGHRAIWMQELDLATRKLVGPRTVLVDGGVDIRTHPAWIEGPHVFKRGGRYYLIAAEGGTGDRHSEVVFRADGVTGPYRPWSGNPILTQRDLPAGRPDPITSTGHADFVQTPKGDWWAVFLGTRPYADDRYNTGRETFLARVNWTPDGWPVITARGQGVPYVARRPDLPRDSAPAPPTAGDFTRHEGFTAATLPLGWEMLRTPRGAPWWRTGGGLALQARPDLLGGAGQPSFLATPQSHMDATASTVVRFAPAADGEEAGLAAFQDEAHYMLVAVAREGARRVVRLERRTDAEQPQTGVEVASAPLYGQPGAPVRLRVIAQGARYTFAYAEAGGAWRSLGPAQDGGALSTHVAGGFTGVMLGLYAYAPGCGGASPVRAPAG